MGSLSAEERSALEQEVDTLKSEGNKEFQNHRFAAAVALYDDAIRKCGDHGLPQLEPLLCNRAFCHTKLENLGSAILDAESALAINATSAKAHYRRGCAYKCLTKYNEAIKDFETAFKQSKDPSAQRHIQECKKLRNQIAFFKAIATETPKPASQTVDPGSIHIDPSYKGPDYDRNCYSSEDLQAIFDFIKIPGNVLHKRYAYMIVLDMIKLLSTHKTLSRIHVPEGEEFTVCGDVHGQFYDLMNIFTLNGPPSESNPYLFNGDFVDRGSFSVECIIALFASKLLYPNHVHLARGNHETCNMNKLYGFEGEVTTKYDSKLYSLFCEAFCLLPLAHLINEKVFVVHGGLFSTDGVTLKEIEDIDRNREPPEDGIMTEMLWSDPQAMPGRAVSKRGVACSFGPDVTDKFLKTNNLNLVIRSHEMKEGGYEVEHNGKLITVFSAPNYCDQMGNKGAFVRLKGPDLKPKFTTYDAVEHPEVKAMAFARPWLMA
eukprot:GHVN01101831.1.p1 GENE.GHVN01101831.1~~GHVN01101831.1.p1  ORF type:complete len:489 (+),score=43.94 GHVN01101831.1:132-1598(+)